LKAPAAEHQATVATGWQAYEVFVCCALIAQGLLQLIALRFGPEVWQQHQFYLRTRSRALPSEQTVRQVLAVLLRQQLRDLPPSTASSRRSTACSTASRRKNPPIPPRSPESSLQSPG
jgi:hypothetical protein